MGFKLDSPVLILNANYEPLSVCNVRRAIGLIATDKALLISNGRGVIRSIRQVMPIPSIIRLHHMIRRPHQRVKLCKIEVFRRDHYTCQYCGRVVSSPTLDHVFPRHLGGTHSWENLVTACQTCNLKKGGKTLDQVHDMHLLRKPMAPPASAVYFFGKYLPNNVEWLPYIEGW